MTTMTSNRTVIIYGDELYHHGVKGQKWGVRRFQNLDGSLTDLGKRLKESRQIRKENRQRKKDYKKAKMITEGEKMRKNGDTMFGNNISTRRKIFTAAIGASIVANMAKSYLDNHKAVLITKQNMAIPLSDISTATVKVGYTAVAGYLAYKNYKTNQKMRAYDNASYKERKQARETVSDYEQ